jgi:hypothetical protein
MESNTQIWLYCGYIALVDDRQCDYITKLKEPPAPQTLINDDPKP